MLSLIPVFILTGVVERHLGVKSDVIPFYYCLGTVVGVMIWLLIKSRGQELAPSPGNWLVLILGMTCGVVANIAIFKALAIAPNPGLPVAIVSTNSVFTFFLMVPLAAMWPKIFQQAQISWRHAIGLALIVVGTSLFSFKQ